MKSSTRFVLLNVGIVGLASLAGSGPEATAQPAAAGYAVEVDIAPDLQGADAYQAQAVVTDLETGRVLARPRLFFLPGRGGKGQLRSGIFRGLELGIQVEVDESRETATYQSETWRGELLVSAHKVRVRLVRPEAAE